MVEAMLTTVDNPYDPFTQFDDWYLFDELKGYCTCGLIDRIAKTSDELSDADNKIIIDTAIEEIALMQPEIYKVVTKNII